MAAAQQRLLELVHHRHHELAYKKRTQIGVEIVEQIEREGHFPHAQYAFDTGVLTVELTRLIEGKGKHWVSELESSRNIQWRGQWQRIAAGATALRQTSAQSFRAIPVRPRNGESNRCWAFTKVVRLRRSGRQRIGIVHARADLTDPPRFLVTAALHWESGRLLATWSFRWAGELFPEFGKQAAGLEAAQVRTEEAVKRHLRLSCVAQSLLQRVPPVASTSEKFAFAQGQRTLGQHCRTLTRQVFRSLLTLAQRLFADGRSCEQVLEGLMPA